MSITIDDAPTGISYLQDDTTSMGNILKCLQKFGIKNAVAFVIGQTAEGNEKILENWLDAGYELGNHTYYHQISSELSAKNFGLSVMKCDSLLREIGAFDKNSNPRWFRFPHLNGGDTFEQRKEFSLILNDLNYRVAPASADIHDYHFDQLLASEPIDDDPIRLGKIYGRYFKVATESIFHYKRIIDASNGTDTPIIIFFHFGLASANKLSEILTYLDRHQTEWLDLSTACSHQLYRDLDTTYGHRGLVSDLIVGHKHKFIFKLYNTFLKYVPFMNEDKLGPRFPYLQC